VSIEQECINEKDALPKNIPFLTRVQNGPAASKVHQKTHTGASFEQEEIWRSLYSTAIDLPRGRYSTAVTEPIIASTDAATRTIPQNRLHRKKYYVTLHVHHLPARTTPLQIVIGCPTQRMEPDGVSFLHATELTVTVISFAPLVASTIHCQPRTIPCYIEAVNRHPRRPIKHIHVRPSPVVPFTPGIVAIRR
jgi:hypothetical protein